MFGKIVPVRSEKKERWEEVEKCVNENDLSSRERLWVLTDSRGPRKSFTQNAQDVTPKCGSLSAYSQNRKQHSLDSNPPIEAHWFHVHPVCAFCVCSCRQHHRTKECRVRHVDWHAGRALSSSRSVGDFEAIGRWSSVCFNFIRQ